MWVEKNTKTFAQNPFLYCFDFLNHVNITDLNILNRNQWLREWCGWQLLSTHYVDIFLPPQKDKEV